MKSPTHLASLLLVGVVGCGSGSPSPGRSVVVHRDATGPVTVDLLEAPHRHPVPFTPSDLDEAALPAGTLGALSGDDRAWALLALNHSPAPCEPCLYVGRSLADCLGASTPGCENLPGLARALVRGVQEGRPRPELVSMLERNHPWTPLPPPVGGLPTLGDGPVRVLVVLDLGDPFGPRGWRAARELAERHPGVVRVEVLPVATERHPGSLEAARVLAAATATGRGLEALEALLAAVPADGAAAQQVGASLGQTAWQRWWGRARVDATVAASSRAVAALGVGTTPSLVVGGYRVHGLEPAVVFDAHVRLVQAVERGS